MSSKWLAIRADASIDIGSGHIMRCLSLAQGFIKEGYKTVFLCRSIPAPLSLLLKKSGVDKIVTLEKSEATPGNDKYAHSEWLQVPEKTDSLETSNQLKRLAVKFGRPPECVIVDHYALAAPWQLEVSELAPIFVIDDLNDRPHQCTWLLDQTVGKVEHCYKGLVPGSTTFFLGPKYALLREEFSGLRAKASFRGCRNNRKLLVTLGGVDKDNTTALVIGALKLISNIDLEVDVIAGAGNPHFEKLKSLVDSMNLQINLYRSVENMADMMLDSDLCIGAAGSTSWERCTLGVPTINLVLAENQKVIAENLATLGAARDFGVMTSSRIGELASQIEMLLKAEADLERMRSAALDVCDGLGVERVVKSVLGSL